MNLSKRDQKHLWHPLTQHKTAGDMLAMVKGKGVHLWDEDGNQYIDAISSWYTTVYGHCNKEITASVAEQMQTLDQVVFSGFTHAPAVELSEALIKILPHNQEKLFFSDNGSTSVEIAIKMALQYHYNKAQKRNILVAFEEGFHGDTFGAMSVSDLSVYNGPFEEFFIEVRRIPVPTGENNSDVLQKLEQLIKTEAVAGFLYEPLVQGAAAMKMHDAKGLCQLIRLCQEHDVITIADEVMTGFGKTGAYFASDHMLNKPDIMCLSKALTAGLLPMAITSCSQKIYDAFYDDDLTKGFFHGHTYTANPLACRAALAGINLLISAKIQQGINSIISAHHAFNQKIKEHPMVKQTRHCGVIFALDLNIEMTRYGNLRNQLFQFFMERGVFLRPLGNTIYVLPPYVISTKELEQIYAVILECLDHPMLAQQD